MVWLEPWQICFDSPYSVSFTRRYKADENRTGTRGLHIFRIGMRGEYEGHASDIVEWNDDIEFREAARARHRAKVQTAGKHWWWRR